MGGGAILREINAMNKSKALKQQYDMMDNNSADKDNLEGKIVKKILRIRLTDEEYTLLQKLKAKKKRMPNNNK